MSDFKKILLVLGSLLWAMSASAVPMLLGYPFIPCGGSKTCNSWNPADLSAGVTLSNSNLTATDTTGNTTDAAGRSLQHVTSGKLYWEVDYTNLSGADSGSGVASSAAILTGGANCLGCNAHQGFMVFYQGTAWFNGANVAFCNPTIPTGPRFAMFAIDRNTNLAWFRCGASGPFQCTQHWIGTNNGVGDDPVRETHGIDISAVFGAQDMYAAYSFNVNTTNLTANFGNHAFGCRVPPGYQAGWYQ